jgi:NADPH:quinone reductase
MKAIGLTEWGGPEVLHAMELPEPEAGPGQLKIRVRAAAVNPADTLLRSGGMAAQLADVPPPFVPGMDAAGVLEQVGAGVVTDLRPGDRVVAVVSPRGSHGAYAEHVVVPAESVVRAPAGATDAEAATLPMNGLTALQAMDTLALRPGQTLAVTGAAGAVGGNAVQLAKAEGLRVVADASAADEPLVRDLGADIVVRRGNDFADRVREVLPEGTDAVVDSALLNQLVLPAVRDGGQIVTLRGFRGPRERVRDITFHPIDVADYARAHARFDHLRQMAEDGLITLRVAGTFPEAQAAQAHRALEAGGARGRLVLEF